MNTVAVRILIEFSSLEDLNCFSGALERCLLEGVLLKEYWRRSLVKAITYRIVIIFLDITVIYLMTGRLDIALGFMIVSNVYTSVAYYFHERIWNKISLGKDKIRANCNYTRLRLI